MKVIKVTTLDGKTVGINKEFIVSIEPITKKVGKQNDDGFISETETVKYSEVTTTSNTFRVTETLEEILSLPFYL